MMNKIASYRLSRVSLLVILLVSLAGGVIVGDFLLGFLNQSFTTVAYLKLNSDPSTNSPEQQYSPEEYEFFKQTQLDLLKSEFVLTSALNRRDIANLNAVVSRRPNELAWLQKELQVTFPGEDELMMIRYEGEEDPEEMKKIINAVVQASTIEVVASDGWSDSKAASSLEKLLNELEGDLRSKTKKYTLLVDELESQASMGEDTEALRKAIIELEATRDQLLLRMRKFRSKDDTSEEKVRYFQKAISTPKISFAQRCAMAALGGAATFVLICLVMALIGKCLGSRDASR